MQRPRLTQKTMQGLVDMKILAAGYLEGVGEDILNLYPNIDRANNYVTALGAWYVWKKETEKQLKTAKFIDKVYLKKGNINANS